MIPFEDLPAVRTFRELVRNTEPATLRSLVEQAIAATDAASLALDRNWKHPSDENEVWSEHADDLAYVTRKALADYLLTEHGLTTALLKRLGEVLPC